MVSLEFLKTVQPFNTLPTNILEAAAQEMKEITYSSRDKVLYEQEVSLLRGIEIIVEGSFETFFYDSAQNKRDIDVLSPGDIFGGISILQNQRLAVRTVIPHYNTKVYFLHRRTFRALCKRNAAFLQFFTQDFGARMLDPDFAHFYKRPAWKDDGFALSDQYFSKKVESVAFRNVVLADQGETSSNAALKMGQQKVSCLFVQDPRGDIVGYITDIILRDKIVAEKRSPDTLISEIMSENLVYVDSEDFVFNAILKMYRTHSKYILVKNGEKIVGFLSKNRLMAAQSQAPILFIQSVKLAETDLELQSKWRDVPAIISQLLERGIHAGIANKVITTVSDTIVTKVIDNVIAEMGTPPAKFCFMVLGSEGRKEQTFKTDQDNAIIYEDKANDHREEVRAYFLAFATRVSDKLNNIGFVFCSGGFMAKNPQWTHSLSHWKQNYESWITEAIPENVINFSTFFDCRFIYGDKTIMKELYDFLEEELRKPLERVFYFMAQNALQYEPQLNFFRGIKTFKKNDTDVFDIKKAMTPIVDLIRVYSLKNQIFDLNTGDRINELYRKGIFSQKEYTEISQSYYTLMNMRLRHQSQQIIVDKSLPDNDIAVKSLSRIDVLTLTEIFKIIKNFQLKIKMEFTKQL